MAYNVFGETLNPAQSKATDLSTGWLYIKSPSVFRRQLYVTSRRHSSDDVTDATVQAPPTLSLTVGVTDGGSPPRSTLGRLLVVASAGPDGEVPVVVSSTSSVASITWIQRLLIVVGSVLGAGLLATVFFIVMVSRLSVL